MMESSTIPDLEQGLVARLAEIERKISELTQDREALRRMLLKVRKESLGRKDVTRTNSYDRILIENEVLQALRGSSSPLSNSELLDRVKRMHPKINDNTFRSYMHRMKAKGLIKNAESHGHVELAGDLNVLPEPTARWLPHRLRGRSPYLPPPKDDQ